ncbi:MAG TPA: transketolase, partial [Ruminococcaceae bacterium]|nr:transketolase [Oscillospiraceae bacterium]
MDAITKNRLEIAATKIRMAVIEGTYHAKSGHPGGSLSICDTLAVLYFQHMRVDPQNPGWEDRDRLVLSKGHTAPALYGALAHRGFFPVGDISTLRHIGSHLQGHPDMKGTP